MKTKHLVSIGHIAYTAGDSVQKVQQIIDDIGAVPVFTIDAVPHYDAEVCGTVVARVHGWKTQPAYHRHFDEIRGSADE